MSPSAAIYRLTVAPSNSMSETNLHFRLGFDENGFLACLPCVAIHDSVLVRCLKVGTKSKHHGL